MVGGRNLSILLGMAVGGLEILYLALPELALFHPQKHWPQTAQEVGVTAVALPYRLPCSRPDDNTPRSMLPG